MEIHLPTNPRLSSLTTNSTTTPLSTAVIEVLHCDTGDKNWQIVGILQIVCASLSFFGALSLISYSFGKRIYTSSEVRPLFHLTCADLLLAVFLILSSTFFQFRLPCIFFQALSEMFYLMTFLLTANYALNTYVRMKDRYHRMNNLVQLREQKWFGGVLSLGYCFSWLAPAIVMIPAYVIIFSEKQDPCALCTSLFFQVSSNDSSGKAQTKAWHSYGAILFLSTLLFSLVAIIIMYFLTYKVYQILVYGQNEYTDRQRSGITGLQKRVTLYVCVFLFCWTPAFILAIFEISQGKPLPAEMHLFLYILQSVTAPSQGLLNSLVYGWTKRSFFRSSRENSSLIPQTYRFYGASNSKRKYPQVPVRNRSASDGQKLYIDD